MGDSCCVLNLGVGVDLRVVLRGEGSVGSSEDLARFRVFVSDMYCVSIPPVSCSILSVIVSP